MRQGAADLKACEDLQNAERYIQMLSGVWWEPDRPSWRSSFYDNQLADIRVESIAALSDIKPAVDISCTVEAYAKQAEIAHKVIRHEWMNQELDLKVAELIDHALFGSGIWKIVGYTPGRMAISVHSRGQVIPVQMDGNNIQSAEAIIYRVYKSLSYYYRRFGPEFAEKLTRYAVSIQSALQSDKWIRPDDIPDYQWQSLSPAMKRRMHLSRNAGTQPGKGLYSSFSNPYPIIELREIYCEDPSINESGHPVLVKNPNLSVEDHNYHYIVQPRGALYPRKRLAVFAGEDIAYDGPSPFWDGMYPFVELQLNPCVWAPGGISKYRDIVPFVNSLNRIGAGVEESAIDAVNRSIVTRKGAIDPVTWDKLDPSKPKQKIMLNGSADPSRDLRYLEAKQLPAYVEMWLRYLGDGIRKKSGALDISGLSRKRQAPGGDTIASMQDAMSGPFRLESRYLESFLRRAAVMAVSRVFQFYTLPQRLKILGEDGQTWQDYDYVAESMVPASSPKEDHWQIFSIQIAPGTMHGAMEHMKKQVAMILRRGGDLSQRGLYRALNIGENVDTVQKELEDEHKRGIGPIAAGRTPRGTRSQRNGSPI